MSSGWEPKRRGCELPNFGITKGLKMGDASEVDEHRVQGSSWRLWKKSQTCAPVDYEGIKCPGVPLLEVLLRGTQFKLFLYYCAKMALWNEISETLLWETWSEWGVKWGSCHLAGATCHEGASVSVIKLSGIRSVTARNSQTGKFPEQ